jgi:polysaccharide export outer membrane protein
MLIGGAGLLRIRFARKEHDVESYKHMHSLRFVVLLLFLAPWIEASGHGQETSNQIDCMDPLYSSSAICSGSQITPSQASSSTFATPQGATATREIDPGSVSRNQANQQLYVDSAGSDVHQRSALNNPETIFSRDPITDFQRLVQVSSGEFLPVFGRDMFQRAPSTFAPGDQLPAAADYVLGPGDQVLLRLWGPETFNSQLTVDTAGSIYIPKVGAVHVAGLRFDELQQQISAEVNRIYRNYQISVNLGSLRSIQVYVVGEARRPGAYTISALSTVLNALFASGGPNVQGSLRSIQIRRNGHTFPEFDLYDLVLSGDKSKDLRLESGDIIFIPPVGAQVALSGSVRHPAIYEVKPKFTVEDVLKLAGGFSAIGISSYLKLERIESDHSRQAMNVSLNGAGRTMVLRDGDVLFADHISPGYVGSVTLRGNLASPGRFAWHEGMKLSDIIPDRMSLLTNNYWRERNRLGVPSPLFEPLLRTPVQHSESNFNKSNNPYPAGNGAANQTNFTGANADNGAQNSSMSATPLGLEAEALAASQNSSSNQASQASFFGADPSNAPVPATLASAQQNTGSVLEGSPSTQLRPVDASGQQLPRNLIQIPAPEIDWSYAVIERLDPLTLKSSLLPFNLGRLVQDHDATQNLELEPGDVVTILSQNDILSPIDLQTKYIRLEGEFVAAGIYSVAPGETLDHLVERAGGFTTKAYLYGSSFQRVSARIFQQQRLDEYISTLSTDMERSAAVRAASSQSGIQDPNSLAEQRSLVTHLRQMRATGRVVLEFHPASNGIASVPQIPLENGDVFRVPSKPNTVSVIGAVYGQNVFLYDPSRRLEDYVDLAGKPNRIADRKHAFIIRADGSIFSRETAKGPFTNHFDASRINAGDSIVIPEKLIGPTVMKQLIDYSQILSSFGLAAAAINVVR